MDGKVSQWLSDRDQLEVSFQNYLKRRVVRRISRSENLVKAHLEKADHNLEFSYFLLNQDRFLDWTIVGLYYAVYHASLALLAESGFSSKDHNATLCLLIRNYSEFSKEDIELYYDLAITQEEIKFYTLLKSERQKASYSARIVFDEEHVTELRKKAITFVNKAKTILQS